MRSHRGEAPNPAAAGRRNRRSGAGVRATIYGLALLGFAAHATAQPAPTVNSAAWMLPGCRAALTPSPNPDFRQGMCAGSLGTLLFLGDALPDQYRVCRPPEA